MPRRAAVLAFLAFVLLATGTAASTAQLLQNGGFEQGTSGWRGGSSSSDCVPRGGSAALALSGRSGLAWQALSHPPAEGNYQFSGFASVQSGSASIEAMLEWSDGDGKTIRVVSTSVPAGGSYASFSVSAPRPPTATLLSVRVTSSGSADALVCLDDFRLDGPAAATASTATTPTATATPTTTSTPLPTVAPPPTVTPRPTSTPRPSATPPPPPTVTPAPSATPLPPTATQPPPETVAAARVAPSPTASTTPTPFPSPVASPTPFEEVKAAFSDNVASADATEEAPLLTASADADDGVPRAWLFGAALFAAGIGASFALHRRAP